MWGIQNKDDEDEEGEKGEKAHTESHESDPSNKNRVEEENAHKKSSSEELIVSHR